MARRRALIVEAKGERFRFYYDLQHLDTLHITQWHGTTPVEAMRTFFEGENEAWNGDPSRFETHTESCGLYWTRHAYDQSVIIISCFKRGDV